jgi:hypothetical protein
MRRRGNSFVDSFAGRLFGCVMLGLAMSLAGAAAAAGPEVGKALEPLKVEVLQAGGEYAVRDIAADAKEKPVVYLLVVAKKWDRPVARFVKTLDDKLAGYSAAAEIQAVWLTPDLNATKEYLPRVAQSLKFQNVGLSVFSDEAGPEGWQPASDAQLAVVVANKGRISATFSFASVNETDVPQVGEAIKKALDEK